MRMTQGTVSCSSAAERGLFTNVRRSIGDAVPTPCSASHAAAGSSPGCTPPSFLRSAWHAGRVRAEAQFESGSLPVDDLRAAPRDPGRIGDRLPGVAFGAERFGRGICDLALVCA